MDFTISSFTYQSADRQYRDSVGSTAENNSSIFSPNPNALVAVSNSTQAVKLCSTKILKYLTEMLTNKG